MSTFLSDLTGYDIEEQETFQLMLNVSSIIAIAEDTFVIYDDNKSDFIEHTGCEIYTDNSVCYKVLDAYEKILSLLTYCE
ncbi:TPA: hypothetical protein TXL51_001508 [Streptococcus suis]|nr:hypothetical protein [Streptococcus suis]